jgi:hypothetical protein
LVYLGGVLTHVVTLLAGCVITVVIGIVEKRILKCPISLKTEGGILLFFVFFACFQTWRYEYQRANNETQRAKVAELAQKQQPPNVQVIVHPIIIPATLVIVLAANLLETAMNHAIHPTISNST